jgi:hypothetical protein
MIQAIFALAFLTAPARALGPIPNGSYVGSETCTGYGTFKETLVFDDNSIVWDGQKNVFTVDENGYFTMQTANGMDGHAMGHFTKNGMHYEAIFQVTRDDGTTGPASGEDTFTIDGNKLTLVASASAGKKGVIGCTGEFVKQ